MGVLEKMNVGVVGAAGRGRAFRLGLEHGGARLHAVCDLDEKRLEQAMSLFGAAEKYTDYETMLDRAELDAVIVATPMQLHVEQSIRGLERGLHVLSEVPAGVSIDECRRLTEACARATTVYMMAENGNYFRENMLVTNLVRQGLFGEVYYAEGEYLHAIKRLFVETPWRRHWQAGVPGVTYGTHSLGPILSWMPGDRVARVCCETSGSHHRDPDGEPYAQDTAVMLGKTVRGALVKVRLDIVSDRPNANMNLQLQGTDGAYESSRTPRGPERGKIWLRALSDEIKWHDPESLMSVRELADKYMPAEWREAPPEALEAGHGGSDYFVVRDFVRAARGEQPTPIGIHEALDMTLPGLVSQESARLDGQWLDVPDSRDWI